MKIQLLSDLHLESNPGFMPSPAPGTDVLVLAGDIGSYQAGSALSKTGDTDFGLARFSPLHGWPTPVLFVPGNHEYDGLDFDEAHARLQDSCARLGITWLEREVVQMGQVRFVGTTLWTDFDALGPLAGQKIPDPLVDKIPAHFSHPNSQFTRQIKARDKAFRAANYYLRKAMTTRQGEAWLAEGLRAQALQCQEWLSQALNTPFDGRTVVITHFAPSLHSADPRYGRVPGTAGFCNALDALLPQAQLWLHGHLHCPSDYTLNGCRVVANPLGYAHKNEQKTFKPIELISL
ncbi:metallophosphoesterase [Limnohabitans sp. Rim28]|uniref:metallophosphoesterase n=1 Tax=Limnohabitans sp. Rim28 TaxID=1100720 RepID=UPI0002F0F025|nr:metallophosphoesterase [Limnohabitans sp. Rim28]PVE06914.1 metallophosphoesterase [Limnohabitans sp. Rim28]